MDARSAYVSQSGVITGSSAQTPAQTPPRTLVIYAGDSAYAYPMLMSAQSVRQHASGSFDIAIFAADYPTDLLDRTRAAADALDVTVTAMDSRDYLRFDTTRFRVESAFRHLKPAVLSRLVTGPLIPDRYEQVLYLDGDTLCVGDLTPLVTFRAPAGRLLGAADSVNFLKHDQGRYAASRRSLMHTFGLDVNDTWFNTGVLLADRTTWTERGAAALDWFVDHIDVCPFPVDGSTNATAKGLWLPISCRWNFMAPMRMWGMDRAISPVLYHFTGGEKPWLGRMAPWQDFSSRYEATRTGGALASLAGPVASPAEVAAANRRRLWGSLKTATVHRHRAARARAALLAHEPTTVI